MISLINHDSSEGEQWGRYNLPRLISVIPFKYWDGTWWNGFFSAAQISSKLPMPRPSRHHPCCQWPLARRRSHRRPARKWTSWESIQFCMKHQQFSVGWPIEHVLSSWQARLDYLAGSISKKILIEMQSEKQLSIPVWLRSLRIIIQQTNMFDRFDLFNGKHPQHDHF